MKASRLHPASSRACARALAAGFSLVELLAATAIAGLFASMAYPSFAATLHKARRSEAMVALLHAQQAQERFRSDGSRYGSLAEIGVAAAVPGGHYVLTVESPDAAGYVATATATGPQAGDTRCRHLKVVVEAGSWRTASGPTHEAGNDAAANRRCWNQ